MQSAYQEALALKGSGRALPTAPLPTSQIDQLAHGLEKWIQSHPTDLPTRNRYSTHRTAPQNCDLYRRIAPRFNDCHWSSSVAVELLRGRVQRYLELVAAPQSQSRPPQPPPSHRLPPPEQPPPLQLLAAPSAGRRSPRKQQPAMEALEQ
jgi:hypothetical protein